MCRWSAGIKSQHASHIGVLALSNACENAGSTSTAQCAKEAHCV